jgi:hypothetical protein
MLHLALLEPDVLVALPPPPLPAAQLPPDAPGVAVPSVNSRHIVTVKLMRRRVDYTYFARICRIPLLAFDFSLRVVM